MKNIILGLIPFLIVIGGILVIATITTTGRNSSNYNLALNRVQLCILSVPVSERTIDDIKKCYTQVEEETGIDLIRDIES